MKPKLHILIGLLLLAVAVVSCHDKTPENFVSPCDANPGTCKSVLEAKDFFLFKVGSYWVYEEETSHERDSMYVLEYYNDETGYDFLIHTKSSLTDYEYRYWPTYYQNISGCNPTLPSTKRCIYVNRSKGKFQDDLGETKIFFVNYKVNDFIYNQSDLNYCPSSKMTIGAVLDTFQVNNAVFLNVVRIDENCSFQEGKQPANIFYSKNVGIIRKELIDSNQVWNLVNYHVIQ